MDILHVTAYYTPHLGGQEVAVRSLTQVLSTRKDVKVRVVTSDRGGAHGLTHEGKVAVTRLRSFEFAHMAIIFSLFMWLIKNTNKNTIVHLHIGQAYTPEIVWLASKIKRFQYIAQMHAEPEPTGNMGILLPTYKKYVLRYALRGASIIFVLNKRHQRIIRDRYGYQKEIKIVSNGIDQSFFDVKHTVNKNTRSLFNILFVGRLSPTKNVPLLLEALRLVKMPIALTIVGDGEAKEEIENIISKYHMNNVIMTGALSKDQAIEYYRTSDVLVIPSSGEAQCLVLLEAMAMELPAIGTNVIGIQEMLKDVGILVELNARSLAEGIEYAYTHPDVLRKLAKKGFTKVSHLKWDELLPNYTDSYDMLVENN